jgi:pimeloyl-ACP methyl ester carboxylesterase
MVLLALGGLLASLVAAQSPPRYTIGFADTLLFNDSLRYTGFGYDGPAPLFVQAWFPVEESATAPKLSFHQLRDRRLEQPLLRVYRELLLRMDSAFIEYDLRYPFGGDEPIDYAPFTEQQVKDSLFAGPTRARRIPFPERSERPVIVYHHGSQGFSDENVRMAENFANWGFIFLSCNFHWPLEGKPYGTPLDWKPDRQSIHTMLRFARDMNSGRKVFYIGHSWGAQEGWCTLHEHGLADAFVSLETTMEWKTDTAEVRDKWPDMLEAITTHSYPMPILMVADTEGDPPFPLFTGVRGDLSYLDPKEPFAHEAYTSAYLLRVAGDGRFPVPDATELWQQNTVYLALFGEMLDFLRIRSGMPAFLPEQHEDDPFHRYPAQGTGLMRR